MHAEAILLPLQHADFTIPTVACPPFNPAGNGLRAKLPTRTR